MASVDVELASLTVGDSASDWPPRTFQEAESSYN